jgi:hypothetical protein
MTYAEKLLDPRWQKKRLEILERDQWTCQLCNEKEVTLHVHHLKYKSSPWDVSNDDLVTYCKHCHALIEFLKREYKGNMMKYIIKEPPVFIDKPLYYIKIGDQHSDDFDRVLLIEIINDEPKFIFCLWPSQVLSLNTIFDSNKLDSIYV